MSDRNAGDPPQGFALLDGGPGFGAAFGPMYVRRGKGGGTLAFRVGPCHVNLAGNCHGGAMATFADMQVAATRTTGGDPATHTPTISLSLDFVGPAPLGAWVECDVTLIKTTRRLVFTQALMRVDGAPVARSTAIYRNHAGA